MRGLAHCNRTRSKAIGQIARRQGFTLLEIILSIAILAGSVAALGEVLRLATMNGQKAREETQAQMLASSIMDELLSGYRSLEIMSSTPIDSDADPPWVYSIDFEQTDHQELVLARIRVEQQLPREQHPAYFELTRWLTNQDYIPAATDGKSTDNTTTSSSTTSSSGSGSGQSSGGGTQR